MAEPKDPREPRIPKESPPFDADNRWTRTWIMYFESLFKLSVKEAVRLAGTVTHTTGELTKDLPVFGNDKADIKVGTKSGDTNEVATVSGARVTGHTVKWDAAGNLIDAATAPGGGVTAVTGTAPIASSGGTTPAISIAAFTGDSGSGGAKGAVPAPASGDAAAGKVLGAGGGWVAGGAGTVTHTGGALTADQPVFGAGSADVKVGTKTGNTDKVVTNTGTNVSGNTVQWDANGNLVDAGTTPGGSGTVTHTGGALTADQPMFGAGSADSKVGTKTGNSNKVVTNTGTNVTGNTVKWDASGNLIDAGSAPGGPGTVTSVALTVPAEFSVSGSPVTTAGTLAVSKATQSANAVFAGPTTGSAAAPTFRAVVPADLPLASSSAFGAVKVDGTTITAASGVISAIGGGSGGSGGALVLLESHTASSSASLDFTTRNASGQSGATIQSDFDEYEIHFVGIVPGTTNVAWQMKVSTDGGATYVGGTSYNSGLLYSGIGDVPSQATSTGAAAITLASSVSTTSNYSVNGEISLFNPGGSGFKFINGKTQAMAAGNMYQWGNTGVYLATTAVNAFQFLFSSGNIASGIIRVYGVAKTTPGGGAGGGLYPPMAPPAIASFSWVNQLSTTVTDNGSRVTFVMPTNGTDPNFRLYLSSASVGSSHTVKLAFSPNNPFSTSYWDAGIVIRNSGTGKFMFFGMDSNAPRIRVISFNAVSSVGGVLAGATGLAIASPILFLKITDDGTTRKYWISPNGNDYYLYYSEAHNTFVTPDQAGIGMANFTGVDQGIGAYDWSVT